MVVAEKTWLAVSDNCSRGSQVAVLVTTVTVEFFLFAARLFLSPMLCVVGNLVEFTLIQTAHF